MSYRNTSISLRVTDSYTARHVNGTNWGPWTTYVTGAYRGRC